MATFPGLGNPTNLPFLPLSGGTLTGSLTLPSSGSVVFGTRGSISASADGIFQLTGNDGSTFGRLALGTATSGPQLKYGSATVLAIRTGSDAAYADVQMGNFETYSGSTVKYYTVLGSALISLGSDMAFAWANAAGANQTKDVGINRAAVGILAITNGSSGFGDLKMGVSALTAGTATVTSSALVREVLHRFDVTNAMVVALGGALTGDVLIATLPAKTVVINAYIVVTGTAAGVATLTGAVGRTGVAYIDYIVASDMKVAANTVYGDASGERGTNLTGYDMPSFTGTTAVNMHFISTVQNLSSTTGFSCSVYLETMTLP